ncbi:hypothetical protein BDD12DRAFT_873423 [Trichophaea hybrida]|nr:hypothetical protein BDD12DRAFT_873423 [Trichophaea hybrida]
MSNVSKKRTASSRLSLQEGRIIKSMPQIKRPSCKPLHSTTYESASPLAPEIYIHPVFSQILKPDQVEGIQHLWRQIVLRRSGVLLAHRQGSGKTLTVLVFLFTLWSATLEHRYLKLPENKHVLILTPPTLIGPGWEAELKKWGGRFLEGSEERRFFENFYTVRSELNAMRRVEALEKWHENGGICIISNILFRNMVNAAWPHIADEGDSDEEDETEQEEVSKGVKEKDEEVLDILKTHIHRAASKTSTPLKIAVTGVPLANAVTKYLTLLRWLAPDVVDQFMETNDSCELENWMRGIIAMARPIKHRNNATAVNKLIGNKTELIIRVPLTRMQFDIYKTLIEMTGDGGREWTGLANRLRMLCNHPQAFRMKYHSLPLKPCSPNPESSESPEDQYLAKYTSANSLIDNI